MTERALLLTDLVDSTKLAERLGDARAAEAMAAHDRVARDLLPTHGGREIDKSDGFLLLFESAEGGASYAIAYHAALRELSARLGVGLAARAGVHFGEVTLRENEPADVARGAKLLEVEGLAKSVAARAMGVARGGQTLMTAEAREALGRTKLRVESHGHWRVKGLAEPMELFEIGAEASPWTPPEDGAKAYRVVERDGLWIPRREVRRSLPAESDVFIGREADLDALARLLHGGESRLVTLIGTGGTGKTRLARRFAWTWLGDYPGGAWHCDLSEARSVEEICSAVARALDVPLGKDDPVLQLGHAIAGRGKCLVILDNFEQLVEHAAATLGQWVDRAAEARFVVTSRERLALPSETLFPVEPLPEDPALRLFEARARAQDPSFVVTNSNRADILAIVTTLDGLPLAIELAAARIRVLPPAALRERLKDRFNVLAGARGAARRQATLRAAIDWSWALLSPWEQAALAQASVFVGGFTLSAGERVLDLSPWPEASPVRDIVQSLLDKSLLRRTPAAGRRLAIDEPYFGMYLSIHEYAVEKLRTEGALQAGASGAAAERTAFDRHGRCFASYGTQEALDALDTHGGIARRQALALELENLAAASRRAVARDDGPTAVATLAAAWTALALKGPILVGAEMARQVVGLGTLTPADRGRAALILAEALRMTGRTGEPSRHYQDALAIAREAGDRRFEGIVLCNLGLLHLEQGRMEQSSRHYLDALAIAGEVGDRRLEGQVLGNLGKLHLEQGRMQEALRHYQDALAIAREVGARGSEGFVLGSLGSLHAAQDRLEEARNYFLDALAIHREVGDRRIESIVLVNLGRLHLEQGRMQEALRHYNDALAIAREVGARSSEGIVLGNLGSLHRAQGRMEEALRHYHDALAIHREVGNRRFEGIVLGNLGNLHRDQGRMEEALRHYQDALLIHREVGDRRIEGAVLGNLGILHADQGRIEEALRHYQDALAIAREVGARSSEGLVFGNLGNLHRDQGRMEEALRHYQDALAIHREVGDLRFEGVVLGELAELHARAGRAGDARSALAEGERLLRDVGDPLALGGLLCSLARLERGEDNLEAAAAALARAESCAAAAAAGAASGLGEAIARLRAELGMGAS